MPTRDELYTALRNADKAGDAEGARKLAAYIQTMPADDAASAPTGPLKFKTAAPNSPDSMLGRLGAGAALGVADIGRTALNAASHLPLPEAAQQFIRTKNADFDALTEANKDSTAFKVGRVGGNVAATLPVGGTIAQGLSKVPVLATSAAPLISAVRTGGFTTGLPAATAGGRLADLAVRSAGGAITGGASAALVDPNEAGVGAVVGGALPGAVKLAAAGGNALSGLISGSAEKLMQSAIKPTIKQLQTGDAATAVRTLLDYGINPTQAGVNKLRALIGGLNDQIGTAIANSTATVSKQNVLARLAGVRDQFGKQVSPTADLNTIQGVADDFAAHPSLLGDSIPVQLAQELKQGTYKVLAKKYGQVGAADTEAQKGLARGLKEEIAAAVPEVAGLNAQESKLITTLNVAERRALMELNKNPMGLASLASNPISFAAFMADKSALFKSLAARMMNSSAAGASASGALLERAAGNPLLRGAAPIVSGSGSRE